jgi:hypothetical protein
VREIAVVGQGEGYAVRPHRDAAHQQQRHADGGVQQVGIGPAGQAGGDRLAHRGDGVAIAGQAGPQAGVGGVGPGQAAGELLGHPLVGDVQGFTVDPAGGTHVQDWGADGDLQDGGHAAGSGAEGEVGHLAAYRGTGLGHRGPGVPEGPQSQSLVESGPGDEPARLRAGTARAPRRAASPARGARWAGTRRSGRTTRSRTPTPRERRRRPGRPARAGHGRSWSEPGTCH